MICYSHNHHAPGLTPRIIPTIEEAEAALAAHQAREVPHQHPCACVAAHKLRREWVEKKFQLKTVLDMARGAAANRWMVVPLD